MMLWRQIAIIIFICQGKFSLSIKKKLDILYLVSVLDSSMFQKIKPLLHRFYLLLKVHVISIISALSFICIVCGHYLIII